MGNTIAVDKISGALAKVRDIGIVEDSFVVVNTAITLRSLRSEEYADIINECSELEEVAYLTAYQTGHIVRSLVEVNGVDLRGVDYIEAPKDGGTVKIEKHTWLLKNLVSSWGKEVVFVVYQKFSEVVQLAEDKAKEGVEFRVADETPEEKYRRLMGDLKEVEEEVPEEILKEILADMGFMRQSTAQELKSAMDRTDKLEQELASTPAADAPPATPEPVTDAAAAQAVVEENQALMAKRQPLNQPSSAPPVDPHQTLQAAVEARQVPTGQPEPRAPQQPVQAPTGAVQVVSTAAKRASQIAAMEGDAGNTFDPSQQPVMPEPPKEVAELTGRQEVSEQQVIVDAPPTAGINPRWSPPQRP